MAAYIVRPTGSCRRRSARPFRPPITPAGFSATARPRFRELSGIFDRLVSSAESWWGRLETLAQGRLPGRFFASSRARLREVAKRLGVRHMANLRGCLAR